MYLGRFDEAKECFESLRSLGKGSTADAYLKKVHDAEEKKKNEKNNNDSVPKPKAKPKPNKKKAKRRQK